MIGDLIKATRIQKGYSINELSEKTGISKSYISYIERGIQKNPSLHILVKITKALDIPIECLMERQNESNKIDLDKEWMDLIREAVQLGISKAEFQNFLDFIMFQKENNGDINNRGKNEEESR